MKIQLAIPVAVAAFCFVSCSGNNESSKPKAEVTAEIFDESALSSETEVVLPQPITLAQSFKAAGLQYVAGKTNPVAKKDGYSLKVDQLLNMGIYSTDLAYCAINGKSQEAREYLSALQHLGGKAGLESVFSDKAMIEKFDKSLGNTEALEELIYELQEKTDTYLDDNDLRYLATVEFAGSWVEGMYLGIDDTRKKMDKMAVALTDQMTLLNNVVKGLENHPSKDDKRLQHILSEFKSVSNLYNGFASVQQAAKNKNFTSPKLTAEEFEKLAVKIASLRNEIVTPQQK